MGLGHHCALDGHAAPTAADAANTQLSASTHAAPRTRLCGVAFHPARAHSRRDPVNELYDRACELVDAAQQLSAAAQRPGTAPALPATLGCIETCLGALHESVNGIRSRAVAHPSSDGRARSSRVHSVSAALDALGQELDEAGGAAGAARTTVARLFGDDWAS